MHDKKYLQCPPAGLFKQLVAMLYDSLLIAALLFLATAILLPFNHGEAIEGPVFSFYLLMVIFIFYAWFWNKAGQTLGMKVWKIRIINDYGRNPSWATSFLRLALALFSIACLGLGYWWRLFAPYTWHDRLSHTQIIDVSSVQINSAQT